MTIYVLLSIIFPVLGAVILAFTFLPLVKEHLSGKGYGAGSVQYPRVIAYLTTFVFLLASAGASFGTWQIGSEIDRTNNSTFHEYWNGFEIAAYEESIECRRDGRCRHTYSCDPYMVPVTTTDGEGNVRTTMKTKYRSCPYSTEETSYHVKTTLGDFTFAKGVITGEQFRARKAIPSRLPTEPPAAWVEASERIAAGKPGGVTQVNKYENYILSAHMTLHEEHSNQIDRLLEQRLLPNPVSGVHDHYHAEKLYTVGYTPEHDFDTDVKYLNGALGVENKQGDLHVVMVQHDVEIGPDDYTNALQAYWNNAEVHGRNTIAKNSIVVVMGIDDTADTVEWTRAFTGMPMGNEGMLQAIQSELPGLEVNEKLLGQPRFHPNTEKVEHSDGVLESILFDEYQGFERVSMSGSDEDDIGNGYMYLRESMPVSTTGVVVMSIINVALIVGLFFGAYTFGSAKLSPGYRRYY